MHIFVHFSGRRRVQLCTQKGMRKRGGIGLWLGLQVGGIFGLDLRFEGFGFGVHSAGWHARRLTAVTTATSNPTVVGLRAAVDTLWLDNDRLNHDIRLLRSQMAALRTDNERYVVQDARYQSVLLNFRSDSDNEEDYEDATIDALFAAQDTRVRAEWIAPAPLPGG